MYGILGAWRIAGFSGDVGAPATGVVVGGVTKGRPANGPRAEHMLRFDKLDSVLRWDSDWAGMIGMLLLVGRLGRGTSSASFGSDTSVSARFKAVNLEDGGGLAPEGRGGRALRRLERYCAVGVAGKPAFSAVMHVRSLDALGRVCGRGMDDEDI